MKFLTLLLFFLSVFSGISQNQIIDAVSKSPVSYAHIKSPNGLKGVISDYNGYFVLDSTFIAFDTVIISCIGYDQEKMLVRQLAEKATIVLHPNTQNFSQVTIAAKKTKTKLKTLGITKKPKKNRRAEHVGIGKNGEQKAVWIPNDYSLTGYLKNIHVYVTDLGYPDAHFRIHVYACDIFETKPGKELTQSNIIVAATQGKEWITVDMSNEHIEIGEHGCFIGIEWFDSPLSKHYHDTVYENTRTWDEHKNEYKDTVSSRIRKGNGAVLGGVYQKYRISKNKHWYKGSNEWQNRWNIDSTMYTTDTLPSGIILHYTPDNFYLGVLCIHIDVSFPKDKIELSYKAPKKRKLNRLEKTKQDVFNYPQNNVSELFSSLIKAFENDDFIYALKYLCVYKKGQLDEILSKIDDENESYLSAEEKALIIKNLKDLQAQLDNAVLTKVDDKHFTLSLNNQKYNLILEDGLWKINPYGYRIYE